MDKGVAFDKAMKYYKDDEDRHTKQEKNLSQSRAWIRNHTISFLSSLFDDDLPVREYLQSLQASQKPK